MTPQPMPRMSPYLQNLGRQEGGDPGMVMAMAGEALQGSRSPGLQLGQRAAGATTLGALGCHPVKVLW